MVAGISPRRVSVSPNRVASSAITLSQTQASPMPPPMAAPWMRPINGFGISFRAFSIRASFRASAIRVARSALICAVIQLRSPPAQKTLPAPESTTARTAFDPPSVWAAAVRSSIIAADRALRRSGRFRVTEATPRSSIRTSSVS